MPYLLLDWLKDETLNKHIVHSPYLNTDYIGPKHLAPSGAFGVNIDFEQGKTEHLFIEQQRFGAEFITAAVVGNRPELLDLGIKITDWGIARQAADGGYPQCKDTFHSMEVWLEGWSRAALILRYSNSPAWAKVEPRWKPAMAACADWMLVPETLRKGLEINRPMIHRHWILAAAMEQAANVTGNDHYRKLVRELIDDAVALQKPDGINAEKDGYDISYQTAGLLVASYYYAVATDAKYKEKTARMLERGLEWVAAKELPGGDLSMEGSTRVGKEKHRTGVMKGINYWQVLQAVVFIAHITGRKDFFVLGRRIAARKEGIRPDDLF